jgi:glycosyltransferase involved in cell wall biosynthesis
MRIAFITAGAAGMYCGSCMKDNTLVSALIQQGHDALLIPTYTPIRTDEENISHETVFFGGINVYLQQKSWLFRQTPWILDKLLNFNRLLNWVSPLAQKTKYETLGGLTISMLKGQTGKQRKELKKLIHYLKTEVKPEIILLSNVLLSGIVPALKDNLGVPILGILQGDDIFLDALVAEDRAQCIDLISVNDRHMNGYIATCGYYADFMSGYLKVEREKMHVVYPGLNLKGHGGAAPFRDQHPLVIGYFARICKEKGFHNLAEAYRILRQMPNTPPHRLRISGWLGENHRKYFEEEMGKLRAAGLGSDVEYVDCPAHADKVRFLQGIDVLSVPTTYREPKGLYVLEALANGVPVVQPAHGSFPELVEHTGGGILVETDNPQALAEGLHRILEDHELRRKCGAAGKAAVFDRFTAAAMAAATTDVLKRYL